MRMSRTKPRDWFRILRDLMAAGVSMNEVGRRCGRTVGSVTHWGEGGEPKDSDARVVLSLYKKHCPERYQIHMQEFDPDMLTIREPVYLKPDNAIRGRPKPRRVKAFRTPEGMQSDMFAEAAC